MHAVISACKEKILDNYAADDSETIWETDILVAKLSQEKDKTKRSQLKYVAYGNIHHACLEAQRCTL